MYKFVVFCILMFPFLVMATGEDIEVSINNSSEDLLIEQAQGSKHNLLVNISNKLAEDKTVTLKIDGGSDVLNLLFFDVDLDDKYKEILSQNNNDIQGFCENKSSDSEILKWCEGLKEVELEIASNESLDVYTTIAINSDARDENIRIVVVSEGDIVEDEIEISYKVPNKGLKKILLEKLVVNKESDSKYNISSSVHNEGTEVTEYDFCTIVNPLWIGEEVKTCHGNALEVGDEKIKEYNIDVPKIGKVIIKGGVEYTDKDGQLQQIYSDDVEIFVWPVKVMVILLIIICFCFIFGLLYKYINKNMFGFNKKKKEEKVFTGKYVVKDADNMISIAQSYNIPWKELAEVNEIEPPYVLISGETILVPGEEKEVAEEKVEGIKKNDELDEALEESREQTRIIGTAVHLNEKQVNMREDSVVKMGDMQNEVVINKAVQDSEKSQNHVDVNENTSAINDKENVSQLKTQMKRKVSYAAPENMLSRPTSEPTTSAIDIEWMQDDEELYAEEMYMQEKKMNTKLILSSIIIIIIIGVLGWWIVTIFINKAQTEKVSVDHLIEETVDENVVVDKVIEVNNEHSDTSVVNEESGENNDNAVDEDNSEEKTSNEASDNSDGDDAIEEVSLSDVTIQVLNAGAKVGAAGKVTSDFEKGGYKTNNAANAANDYQGVTIYYAPDDKDYLEGVSEIVSDEYGDKKTEEDNAVAEKYNADFVIVLGA